MSQRRHEELKKLISYHDHLYHVLDRPEISDYDYDLLYQELLKLEQSALKNEKLKLNLTDSPSQGVGNQPLDSFSKKSHRLPMLSLSNTYNIEEIQEFDERVKKFLRGDDGIEYYCEPKY